jgi:hypothetical protein
MTMKLTKHAKIRMQQRGIERQVVDWLAAYGEIDHQRGAEVFFFNQKSRKSLARDVGERLLKRYSKQLDTFMVYTDGAILTVGHRYQRVVRH